MRNKKRKLKIALWNVGRKLTKIDAINLQEWMNKKNLQNSCEGILQRRVFKAEGEGNRECETPNTLGLSHI